MIIDSLAELTRRATNITKTPVPEVRKFTPEQLKGLAIVGYTFSMEARSLSLRQLSADPETEKIAFIGGSDGMMKVVPLARDVAINPDSPFLPNSKNLSFGDQLKKVEDHVERLRNIHLKEGTLEGIDFGIEHASVYVQLASSYRREYGKELLNVFVGTIDIGAHGIFFIERIRAQVGRYSDAWDKLYVIAGFARLAHGDEYIMPVATPAGKR